jgi:hypothetical protein
MNTPTTSSYTEYNEKNIKNGKKHFMFDCIIIHTFSVHKLSAYGLVHKDSKTAACQFWVLLQNKRQNFPDFI